MAPALASPEYFNFLSDTPVRHASSCNIEAVRNSPFFSLSLSFITLSLSLSLFLSHTRAHTRAQHSQASKQVACVSAVMQRVRLTSFISPAPLTLNAAASVHRCSSSLEKSFSYSLWSRECNPVFKLISLWSSATVSVHQATREPELYSRTRNKSQL